MARFEVYKTHHNSLLYKLQSFPKLLLAHKIGLILPVAVIILAAGGLGVRQKFAGSLSLTNKQGAPFNVRLPLTKSSPIPSPSLADSPSPSPTGSSVLGISDNTPAYVPPPLPAYTPPAPISTPTPTPASVPVETTGSTTPSCSGTPNADNSQVYVSPSSTTVNNESTITVDLEDCNNNFVSNDDLTITLTSGDSSTTINGTSASSPYHAHARDGHYSFQVNSSNPTTAIFSIQDTTHNFSVTTPGYHSPKVTFYR